MCVACVQEQKSPFGIKRLLPNLADKSWGKRNTFLFKIIFYFVFFFAAIKKESKKSPLRMLVYPLRFLLLKSQNSLPTVAQTTELSAQPKIYGSQTAHADAGWTSDKHLFNR